MEKITQIPKKEVEVQIIEDPYQVLGISPEASFEEATEAHNSFKIKVHIAVRNGETIDYSQIDRANDAFEVLKKDNELRTKINRHNERKSILTFKQ